MRISWFNREPGNIRDRSENNLFIKKIHRSVTAQDFHEFFGKFGTIISAKLVEDDEGENIGYGFVLYDDKQSAERAIREANGYNLKGKELFVGVFQKNRPKKPPQFNNIYVKNIPKEFTDDMILNHFRAFGEVGSYIIRSPDPNNLDRLPEEKRKFILDHKYAFICFKDYKPASRVVNQVTYQKINNKDYNKELNSLAELARSKGVSEDHMYRCACFIIETVEGYQKSEIQNYIELFEKHLRENDNNYVARDKTDRMECYQALKKNERIKRLKALYEKIKRQIKEKYKYCNLYVKNLPDNFDDEQLRDMFEKFGKLRSFKTVRKELYQSYLGIKRSVKVCGFVCFQDAQSAKEAKTQLNNSNHFNNLPKLFVDYHQSKTDRQELLKLKQISQFSSKGGNKMQEIANQNNVIRQMQFHGLKPQFNTPNFGPHLLRKFPQQTGYSKPPQHQMMMPNILPYPQNFPMNMPMHHMPPQIPDISKMDPNSKREFFGENLHNKISTSPHFAKYNM